MKILKLFSLLIFFAGVYRAGHAQEAFTNCTAAFLNGKLVVDEYSPGGKCVMNANAAGQLTVATVDLSAEEARPTGQLDFKIAIRDGHSKTLMLFSEKTYRKVQVQEVLKKCKKGDAIVLLTLDDEYAFPHHEILIN